MRQGFTDSYGQTLGIDKQPAPANQGGGAAPGISFPGISIPSSDMQAVRDGRRNQLFYFDVDLSSARDFAAGTQAILPLEANFLYIDQRLASGIATLHFQDINGRATPVTMLPGNLWRIPFTQVGIENTAQPGQTLRILYGMDVDALPISAAGVTVLNPVSVVDGSKALTLAGNAFQATNLTVAVAAKLSRLQLWNNSATRRVIVRGFQINTNGGVAGGVEVRIGAVALTDAAPALAHSILGVTGGAVADSAGTQLRSEAVVAAPAGVIIGAYWIEAGKMMERIFINPPILPPSTGLTVTIAVVNVSLEGSFDCEEENI